MQEHAEYMYYSCVVIFRMHASPTAGSLRVLKYIQAAIYSNFRIPPEVSIHT